MKHMKRIVEILLYVWQLPQNLVGLLMLAWLRPEFSIVFRTSKIYYSTEMRGGVSLGHYIFLNDRYWEQGGDSELHEYGHGRQSLFLGPLYLFVIGIPSILWACWWNEDRNRDYYSFYTERWADRLGGVNRC